jgi:hypothetical protein
MANWKSGSYAGTQEWYLTVCVAACIIIAGCAAAPVNPEASHVAPEPGRAVVIGWGNSAGEKARAALTPGRGTRVSSLFVVKVNEQKGGFSENITRLPPGEFELTINCVLYVDSRDFPHDTVVHAALRAGRVYRLRAEPQGRKCQPFLEDVTDAKK